jgi:hypothetical protein
MLTEALEATDLDASGRRQVVRENAAALFRLTA